MREPRPSSVGVRGTNGDAWKDDDASGTVSESKTKGASEAAEPPLPECKK